MKKSGLSKINKIMLLLLLLSSIFIFFFIGSHSRTAWLLNWYIAFAVIFLYFFLILRNLKDNLDGFKEDASGADYRSGVIAFLLFLILLFAGSMIYVFAVNRPVFSMASAGTFFVALASMLLPPAAAAAFVKYVSPASVIPRMQNDDDSLFKYNLIYWPLLLLFAVFSIYQGAHAYQDIINFDKQDKYKAARLSAGYTPELLQVSTDISPETKQILEDEINSFEIPYDHTYHSYTVPDYQEAVNFCRSLNARIPNYAEVYNIAYNYFDVFGDKYYWTSDSDGGVPIVLNYNKVSYTAKKLPEGIEPKLYCVSSAYAGGAEKQRDLTAYIRNNGGAGLNSDAGKGSGSGNGGDDNNSNYKNASDRGFAGKGYGNDRKYSNKNIAGGNVNVSDDGFKTHGNTNDRKYFNSNNSKGNVNVSDDGFKTHGNTNDRKYFNTDGSSKDAEISSSALGSLNDRKFFQIRDIDGRIIEAEASEYGLERVNRLYNFSNGNFGADCKNGACRRYTRALGYGFGSDPAEKDFSSILLTPKKYYYRNYNLDDYEYDQPYKSVRTGSLEILPDDLAVLSGGSKDAPAKETENFDDLDVLLKDIGTISDLKKQEYLYNTKKAAERASADKKLVHFSVVEVSPDTLQKLINAGYRYDPYFTIDKEFEVTPEKEASVLQQRGKEDEIRLCYFPFTDYGTLSPAQQKEIWQQSFCTPAIKLLNETPGYILNSNRNSYCRSLGGRLPNIPELAAILKTKGRTANAKYWTNNRVFDPESGVKHSVTASNNSSGAMTIEKENCNIQAYTYCVTHSNTVSSKVIANYKSKFPGYEGIYYVNRNCPDCYYYEVPDVVVKK